MSTATNTIEALANREYKYGFVTEIESDVAPRGLNEDIVRLISAKKNEPDWMLEWRLKAYRHWATLEKSEAEPKWANVHYPPIDYQDIIYYAAPKQTPKAPGEPRRGGPEAAGDLREAGHPPGGAEAARRRRRGRRLRQRLGGDHVQGEAGRAGDHLLLLLRGGAGPSGAGPEVPRLGGPLQRQLLRRAQLPPSSATARSATSRRACAARWSSRPTSASTPRTPASSSAR